MSLILDASADDLTIYLAEGEEILESLNTNVLVLEKGGRDQHVLQEIFRAAHTMKGSSAAIGHQRMAHLTHLMESVLDRLRKGEIAVTTELMNLLFECLDALRILQNEVITQEESTDDFTALLERLRLVDSARPTADSAGTSPPGAVVSSLPLSDDELRRASLAQAEERLLHVVRTTIDPKSPFSAARSLQVVLELGAVGEVIASDPRTEVIESGNPIERLVVLVASTESTDAIRETAESVEDVLEVEISPYGVPALVTNDAPEIPVAKTLAMESADLPPNTPVDVLSDDSLAAVGAPPPPAAPPTGAIADEQKQVGTSAPAKRVSQTVRVDVERLDNLMNLVGELVIDRTRLARLVAEVEGRLGHDEVTGQLGDTAQHLARLSDELQQEVMKSRMLPIESVFSRFPRLVRDLAQKVGKRVSFVVEGQDTELDRSVIQEIGDPLIHLLRNAVDHGVETPEARRAAGKSEDGTVRLSAFHEENFIVIVVEDDGRGINVERVRESAVNKGLISRERAQQMTETESLNLIFASGLSTAQKVSDVSGRGVGMDIVRTKIERLGGVVSVATENGRGSRFTIKLPVTLAIIPSLLVGLEDAVYAIPLTAVHETLRVERERINSVGGTEAIQLRGRVLPLLELREAFGRPRLEQSRNRILVVAIRYGANEVGLVVDELLGQQEVVVKSLGSSLGRLPGISGATILGDGRVGLIVEVPSLIDMAIRERSRVPAGERHVDEPVAVR